MSRALREMFRQEGLHSFLVDEVLAENGIISRHLILPGYSADSSVVLEFIANEVSTNIHISLTQYYPADEVRINSPLNRTISNEELRKDIEKFGRLGLRGLTQALESNSRFCFYIHDYKPFNDCFR